MESWQELANPRDLTKIFTTPEYAGWRSLRESEDARYLGLAMPLNVRMLQVNEPWRALRPAWHKVLSAI